MLRDIVSGIYCIENITTKRKYIGQSTNINDRWYKHKYSLKHNHHDNDYLQKAWNKYGSEDFTFYILEYCEHDKLDEREIYYIELYNTLDRNYGYNLKSGGQNNGVKATKYVRDKISNALKNTYSENEELRERCRQTALKQWANPEIKAKIIGENNGMYGRHHTEEARRKISESRIGKPSPFRNTTPVYCVELDKKFKDAITACEELSIDKRSAGNIRDVCKGKRKTCGGYHWKFLSEINIS